MSCGLSPGNISISNQPSPMLPAVIVLSLINNVPPSGCTNTFPLVGNSGIADFGHRFFAILLCAPESISISTGVYNFFKLASNRVDVCNRNRSVVFVKSIFINIPATALLNEWSFFINYDRNVSPNNHLLFLVLAKCTNQGHIGTGTKLWFYGFHYLSNVAAWLQNWLNHSL